MRLLLTRVGDFHEWVVTIAFYQGLHLVEDLFVRHDGSHNSSHTDRNARVMKEFPDIWKYYGHLYKESLKARYLDGISNNQTYAAHMVPKNVEAKIINGWLLRLREEIIKALRVAPTATAPVPSKPSKP